MAAREGRQNWERCIRSFEPARTPRPKTQRQPMRQAHSAYVPAVEGAARPAFLAQRTQTEGVQRQRVRVRERSRALETARLFRVHSGVGC